MRRALLTTIFVIAFLLAAGAAGAHELSASVTLEPAVPVPGGSGFLRVRLLAPGGDPFPGARIQGSVEPLGQLPSDLAPLQEGPPGLYSRAVQFPESTAGVVRLDVILPDDRWHAVLPIRLGESWFQVQEMAVELTEGELGSKRPREPAQPQTPPPGPAGPAEQQAPPPAPAEGAAPRGWRVVVAVGAGLAALGLIAIRFAR